MKKIKVEGKLNLNKTTISKLSERQMGAVGGGAADGADADAAAAGFLSIGKNCTQPSRCDIEKWSKSLFCKD